ncbi:MULTISPECIES: TetR/AcrR family transcriptional regulator [Actinoplanes]|uniref:TetR/AcrR family transcriptional regulator n=1 Tax=Actinoplanes TaxID=1865 RepID=UPI0005F29A93|nr:MULTISPECIES: TetR/AcrR family transcriptional regulator [Actinoplanes]
MTELTRRTTGVRHGARSVQVVERVRAAVLAEMTRVGFAAITIDGVARAAAVNRTTIYRRWPSKAALLEAVVEPLLAEHDRDPATGTLRGDLLVLLCRIRDSSARPEGRAIAAAAKASATELGDLMASAVTRTLAPFHRAADHAAARGEIEDASRGRLAVFLAYSGVFMWEQTHGGPPGDDDCATLADLALAGLGCAQESC